MGAPKSLQMVIAAMKLRRVLLGRKVMTNLDSILKSRDITLPTKVRLVKARSVVLVMYGYESWTIKKAEHKDFLRPDLAGRVGDAEGKGAPHPGRGRPRPWLREPLRPGKTQNAGATSTLLWSARKLELHSAQGLLHIEQLGA